MQYYTVCGDSNSQTVVQVMSVNVCEHSVLLSCGSAQSKSIHTTLFITINQKIQKLPVNQAAIDSLFSWWMNRSEADLTHSALWSVKVCQNEQTYARKYQKQNNNNLTSHGNWEQYNYICLVIICK